jgi:YggT family protein
MAQVAYLIRALAYLARLAILARALVSWVHADPYNPLVRFLHQVTEPILRPLRQALPTWQGLDMSPVAALLIIQLVEWLLLRVVLLG